MALPPAWAGRRGSNLQAASNFMGCVQGPLRLLRQELRIVLRGDCFARHRPTSKRKRMQEHETRSPCMTRLLSLECVGYDNPVCRSVATAHAPSLVKADIGPVCRRKRH